MWHKTRRKIQTTLSASLYMLIALATRTRGQCHSNEAIFGGLDSAFDRTREIWNLLFHLSGSNIVLRVTRAPHIGSWRWSRLRRQRCHYMYRSHCCRQRLSEFCIHSYAVVECRNTLFNISRFISQTTQDMTNNDHYNGWRMRAGMRSIKMVSWACG